VRREAGWGGGGGWKKTLGTGCALDRPFPELFSQLCDAYPENSEDKIIKLL
jgi:hypothetical protein